MHPTVMLVATSELAPADREGIRRLMDVAFEDFSEHDWAHALGGWHALVHDRGAVVAHGSVVPRRIRIGERDHRAGYVEAVAVAPHLRRRGLGTAVMTALGGVITTSFDLGVLSTGTARFYERLGWRRWRGPTFIRRGDGRVLRSPEEDGGVMVLLPEAAQGIDLAAPIACDARAGDSW